MQLGFGLVGTGHQPGRDGVWPCNGGYQLVWRATKLQSGNHGSRRAGVAFEPPVEEG